MNGKLIKQIEFLPVNIAANNWSQNTCIVKVTDEKGRYGIGEADGSPDVIAAFANADTEHKWLSRLTDVLIGRDPIEFDANWDCMYETTRWIADSGEKNPWIYVDLGTQAKIYLIVLNWEDARPPRYVVEV